MDNRLYSEIFGEEFEEYHPCDECEGNGWVDDPSDGGTMTCPVCDGEGRV